MKPVASGQSRKLTRVSGILNLNKPAGWTSFDVVARVRRLTGERRVGHAGTLDPMATGVLPICLGKATRVIEYLADLAKTYIADVRFGATTDTYDREGFVTGVSDISALTCEQVASVLTEFRGPIEQVPPMHSALKRGGRPLYELARQGIVVEREPRQIIIYRLEMQDCQLPDVRLEVECSKGTYIRSLAHDLGARLGVGGYLTDLVRTRVGDFRLEDSVTIEMIERAIADEALSSLLLPIDYPLKGWPALKVDSDAARHVLNGRSVTGNLIEPDGTRGLLYAATGQLLAIAVATNGRWQPEKVLADEPE